MIKLVEFLYDFPYLSRDICLHTWRKKYVYNFSCVCQIMNILFIQLNMYDFASLAIVILSQNLVSLVSGSKSQLETLIESVYVKKFCWPKEVELHIYHRRNFRFADSFWGKYVVLCWV